MRLVMNAETKAPIIAATYQQIRIWVSVLKYCTLEKPQLQAMFMPPETKTNRAESVRNYSE